MKTTAPTGEKRADGRAGQTSHTAVVFDEFFIVVLKALNKLKEE